MNMDDKARDAGRAARGAVGDIPPFDDVVRAQRRRHIVAAVGGAFVVVLFAGGLVALWPATEPDDVAIETTTSTAVTTTTTEPATTSTTVPASTTTTEPPSTTTTTRPLTFEPGYGGTVVIADDQAPPTLNPFVRGGDNFIVRRIGQAMFTGAFDIDGATLEIIPEVVTQIPSVANGGLVVNDNGTLTVNYEIRSEAQWSDGVPISGNDFAFTYETVIDLPREGFFSWPYEPYDEIVPGSIVVGDKTFSVTLRRPTLRWQELFDVLLPKHDVEGADFLNDYTTESWVAGGPFVFDRIEPESGLPRIYLVRNENYWKSDPATGMQLPYLDGVEFRIIPETSTLIREFLNREVDVINPPPSNETIGRLLGEGVDVQLRSSPVWEHFSFQLGELNRNGQSLNRFVEFRRAVAHAIDRDAIGAGSIFTGRDRLDSPFEVATRSLTSSPWSQYDYDPERARELLAEACAAAERDCVANPPTLVFSTTSNAEERPRVARLVEEMLEGVGIQVELELEDSCIFFGPTLDTGSFDMGLWAWVASPGTPGAVSTLQIYDPNGPPPEGNNYVRWGTPAVSGVDNEAENFTPQCGSVELNQGASKVRDQHTERYAELIDLMQSTVDDELLRSYIAEAEQILADQVVIIPLVARASLGAVWADEVANYIHNPSQAADTWNIEFWYRVDR